MYVFSYIYFLYNDNNALHDTITCSYAGNYVCIMVAAVCLICDESFHNVRSQ